ncbi:MAG: tRNA uridine-5-carboxymethylaminomethyl(34) synthesis GTPase MnmE [Spirochaetes bacterium]|nr:tRNA uridine-5-carboxymethylaminomethyl(34) synthesis GTPase MnmE [Spirochaetota bacterium]
MFNDTICAPASAPVNSSLAIIRISGSKSYGTAYSFFSPKEKIKHRFAAYGSIRDGDEIIDDVILIYYKSPSSFTGEDMVEIFCHGNHLIAGRILRLLYKHEIRIAEPGEFSKRAFLNGKMDLTEAEAINALINARSDWEIKASINQMHGSLRAIIDKLRNDVIMLKGDIEAGIDFSDQDIEFVSNTESLNIVSDILDSLIELQRRCNIGNRTARGIDVVLAGRPNVGKSSLLNLILNEERAIVSHIPGTTRDLIRESIQIGGVRVNLTDTAGLCIPGDDIEKIGVELSRKNIDKASLVLMVVDASCGITDEDRDIISMLREKNVIYALNKIDLTGDKWKDIIKSEELSLVPISAKFGTGFKELENKIASVIAGEFVDINGSFLVDERIISIIDGSIEIAQRVVELLKLKEPCEIITFELDELISRLSDITGEITTEDVLGSIFSRFCIGK